MLLVLVGVGGGVLLFVGGGGFVLDMDSVLENRLRVSVEDGVSLRVRSDADGVVEMVMEGVRQLGHRPTKP